MSFWTETEKTLKVSKVNSKWKVEHCNDFGRVKDWKIIFKANLMKLNWIQELKIDFYQKLVFCGKHWMHAKFSSFCSIHVQLYPSFVNSFMLILLRLIESCLRWFDGSFSLLMRGSLPLVWYCKKAKEKTVYKTKEKFHQEVNIDLNIMSCDQQMKQLFSVQRV